MAKQPHVRGVPIRRLVSAVVVLIGSMAFSALLIPAGMWLASRAAVDLPVFPHWVDVLLVVVWPGVLGLATLVVPLLILAGVGQKWIIRAAIGAVGVSLVVFLLGIAGLAAAK